MPEDLKLSRLLTTADLAERWGCDEATVLEHVRLDSLYFIPVGKRPTDKSRPGPKCYRFRLADVEAWEAARRMTWGDGGSGVAIAPKAPPVTPKDPVKVGVPGWDGTPRGGRKTRSKPPAP